ncbi:MULTISPECIES: hypothetical protein [unclassified Burkholderia]|uniref:hypothetical protein n=1 Tax=unclassified Burkholderia TaxID=2613784 RepID=UPI000F5B1DB6|nr:MULTISPECIES: hypothetical protein [unclassified Burkholderia]RQS52555.1 hypothetical protein DID99_21185 [Burkholderia sp. Bp8986]RQS56023.1 hypothetical protein DID98_23410 [Burkholderia sp. Bp8984]RQZ35710.1 hypothetical protein DIE16_20095 [Burkholderia sp. Bp9090]
MRELTMMELDEVSGGSFVSRCGASVLGAVGGSISGAWKGAATGGSSGGILGAGIAAAGVGVLVGGALGIIGGALYGLVNDMAQTTRVFNDIMDKLFDFNEPAPKAW